MQIMHFLLNLHYRPMDLSHRVSGTGEPAPAWFVSLTMIWPSVGGKHFINRTGVNQLLLWRWPCLLLPEFMVMWRWENSLQNECSGPTLQMLQVNCYNQTYQCSQAPEWLQSYKRQIEWPLLTDTPYLDIFQYVWELPYHAHDWHILSAWQPRRPHCMWASCQMISKLPVPSSNLWHAFEQKQLPHRDMGARTTANDLFMMPATFNFSPRDPHIQGSNENCKIQVLAFMYNAACRGWESCFWK